MTTVIDNSQERLASIVEDNMGLVVFLIKKHFNSFDESAREDLLQCGRIGIWKAALKFDPARNVEFSTVATNYAKWEMIRHIKKENRWHERHSRVNTMELLQNSEDKQLDSFDFILPDSLSKVEKQIISYKHAGWKNEEIAEMVGLNIHTFKQVYKKAKRKILESNET